MKPQISMSELREKMGYEHLNSIPVTDTWGNTITTTGTLTQPEEKPDAVKRFELITSEMATVFAKKNKDYGNSFDKSLDEDGLLVAKIRLGDKYNRFCQLIKNPAEVKDESITDTLLDMATYAIMTVMWKDLQANKVKEQFGIYSKPAVGSKYEDWIRKFDGITSDVNLEISKHIKKSQGLESVSVPAKFDGLDALTYALSASAGSDFDGDSLPILKPCPGTDCDCDCHDDRPTAISDSYGGFLVGNGLVDND